MRGIVSLPCLHRMANGILDMRDGTNTFKPDVQFNETMTLALAANAIAKFESRNDPYILHGFTGTGTIDSNSTMVVSNSDEQVTLANKFKGGGNFKFQTDCIFSGEFDDFEGDCDFGDDTYDGQNYADISVGDRIESIIQSTAIFSEGMVLKNQPNCHFKFPETAPSGSSFYETTVKRIDGKGPVEIPAASKINIGDSSGSYDLEAPIEGSGQLYVKAGECQMKSDLSSFTGIMAVEGTGVKTVIKSNATLGIGVTFKAEINAIIELEGDIDKSVATFDGDATGTYTDSGMYAVD